MKTLHATIQVPLPDNEFDAAAVMLKVKPLWETFIGNLANAEIKPKSEIATSETKTAPRANGEAPRKRGRKAQTPAAPMLEMGEAG